MNNNKYKEEYIRRIHKVQDYLENHIGVTVTIDELSNIAGFSKYHFSRIFQSLLHEPLAHYVNRIRMERALFLLAHRSDLNMTDIAYELGYADSAVFSRAFKNYYKTSPREYRKEYSKNCKESILLSDYNKYTAKKEWVDDPYPVKGIITKVELPKTQVAYVRHIGTYETLEREYNNMIQTLFQHAKEQELLVEGENVVLAMYHDNPEFTNEAQFRTSLCLTIPQHKKVTEDGVLGTMTLEASLYAVGHFKILQSQYSDAWNFMYQEWLTGSGYVPRDASPFEVYLHIPEDWEDPFHEIEIYVPIEPITF